MSGVTRRVGALSTRTSYQSSTIVSPQFISTVSFQPQRLSSDYIRSTRLSWGLYPHPKEASQGTRPLPPPRTETNRVVSWGTDILGCLGDDSRDFFRTVPHEINFGHDVNIVQVAARDGSCIAVSDKGCVYTWGFHRSQRTANHVWLAYNKAPASARFVRSIPSHLVPRTPYPLKVAPFGQRTLLEGFPLSHLSSWSESTLTSDSLHIVSVAAGPTSYAAVSKDGLLYTWSPGGSYGMLGHSKPQLFSGVPRVVPGVKDVVSVAFGMSHIAILTQSGKVYTAGNATTGALGTPPPFIGDRVTILTPVCVQDALEGHYQMHKDGRSRAFLDTFSGRNMGPVAKIACGNRFTMFLTEKQELWISGNNLLGECGQSIDGEIDIKLKDLPVKLTCFGDQKVVMIAAGGYHGVAVTSKGELWTWGSNRSGQCGRLIDRSGSVRHIMPPGPVFIPESVLRGGRIVKVSASDTATLVYLSDGRILGMGALGHFDLTPRTPYIIEDFDPVQMMNKAKESVAMSMNTNPDTNGDNATTTTSEPKNEVEVGALLPTIKGTSLATRLFTLPSISLSSLTLPWMKGLQDIHTYQNATWNNWYKQVVDPIMVRAKRYKRTKTKGNTIEYSERTSSSSITGSSSTQQPPLPPPPPPSTSYFVTRSTLSRAMDNMYAFLANYTRRRTRNRLTAALEMSRTYETRVQHTFKQFATWSVAVMSRMSSETLRGNVNDALARLEMRRMGISLGEIKFDGQVRLQKMKDLEEKGEEGVKGGDVGNEHKEGEAKDGNTEVKKGEENAEEHGKGKVNEKGEEKDKKEEKEKEVNPEDIHYSEVEINEEYVKRVEEAGPATLYYSVNKRVVVREEFDEEATTAPFTYTLPMYEESKPLPEVVKEMTGMDSALKDESSLARMRDGLREVAVKDVQFGFGVGIAILAKHEKSNNKDSNYQSQPSSPLTSSTPGSTPQSVAGPSAFAKRFQNQGNK